MSADEIEEMIALLSQASLGAVNTMQQGVSATAQVVEEATQVSANLGISVASFDDIVQRSQQIAVASQEQSYVAQEINELAIRLNSSREQGALAAATLRDLGQTIKCLSSRLKSLRRPVAPDVSRNAQARPGR